MYGRNVSHGMFLFTQLKRHVFKKSLVVEMDQKILQIMPNLPLFCTFIIRFESKTRLEHKLFTPKERFLFFVSQERSRMQESIVILLVQVILPMHFVIITVELEICVAALVVSKAVVMGTKHLFFLFTTALDVRIALCVQKNIKACFYMVVVVMVSTLV